MTADRRQVIARRETFDGRPVLLWSDGGLSGALGYGLPGVPMRPRKTRVGVDTRAAWLLLGDVCLYELGELGELFSAARYAAERDGLPGTMRSRFAVTRGRTVLGAHRPSWTVLSADRDGRATERVWVLPRLGFWSGYAVWDYVSRGGSRGRYDLCQRLPDTGAHRRRADEAVYESTGFRFSTQAELMAHLEAAS